MESPLEYLNQIGIALSQERDINKLLETIRSSAGGGGWDGIPAAAGMTVLAMVT